MTDTTKGEECQKVSPEDSHKVVEVLLLLMMEVNTSLTNRNHFQCQHNIRVYFKFGDKCRYKLLLKHVQKGYADQKNVHLDILNHVKIEKTVNF